MQEALKLVRNSLGPDAVILSTRNIRGGSALGYQGKSMVEVTAALDNSRTIESSPYKSQSLPPPREGSISQRIDPAAVQQKMAALSKKEQQKELQSMLNPIQDDISDLKNMMINLLNREKNPGTEDKETELLQADLSELKSMVQLLAEGESKQPPPFHEGLMQVYKEIVGNRVNEAFALKLIQEVRSKIPEEHYKNVGLIKAHVAQEMMRAIKIGGPIRLKKGVPKIAAFVGPTGVGKTTTIAKLAADFALAKKASVALITLDTYRIAAVEQLKTYARILKIPIEVIVNENQLEQTVGSFDQKDLILIDTAGRSKKDEAQLTELVNFLGVDLPIEVYLVLSATGTEESILAAFSKFHPISIDRLLFTKLDESVHYGMIYNVAKKTNKPLSYFTTGQKVPEDIELAEAERLVDLILNLKRAKM